jgi:hypothetical protein
MPTSSGPNTLGESNLVFAYDTGDVSNSYIGEPTTNLYTTLGFGFYQQEGNHTATRTVGVAPNLNLPSNYDYTTIVTTGNWQAEVNRVIIWTNTSLTSGTYNISFWARVTSTSTATIGCAFYGNGINNTMSLTNQWQRFSIQSTTNPTYRATEFGSLSGAITFQIAGLQIELLPHATQYVNGVRSATQGLLPLISNTTINLSNVSFDSNAQIVFDGTDDYIVTTTSIPSNFGTGDFTIEVMIYPQSFISYTHMVALPDQNTFALKADIGNGIIYYYDPSFTTYGSTSGWTLTLNQWNHVVLVRSGNVAYVYLNGASKGSKTGFNTNLSSTQIVNIGNGGTLEHTPKKINLVKIYNIALTADQVKQNYQQYKTRFNLS